MILLSVTSFFSISCSSSLWYGYYSSVNVDAFLVSLRIRNLCFTRFLLTRYLSLNPVGETYYEDASLLEWPNNAYVYIRAYSVYIRAYSWVGQAKSSATLSTNLWATRTHQIALRDFPALLSRPLRVVTRVHQANNSGSCTLGRTLFTVNAYSQIHYNGSLHIGFHMYTQNTRTHDITRYHTISQDKIWFTQLVLRCFRCQTAVREMSTFIFID